MEPASIPRRLTAFFIDHIFIYFPFLILYVYLFYFSKTLYFIEIFKLSSLALFLLYFILSTYLLKGQTLGKKFLKIAVLNTKGKLDIKIIVVRYIALYIFIYASSWIVDLLSPVGIINSLMGWATVAGYLMVMVKDKENRALHDMVAGTKVVRLK